SSTKRPVRPHHLAKPLLLTMLHILLQLKAITALTDDATAPVIQCLPDQASALLRLKHSFNTTAGGYSTTFRSWITGTDCCHWEGIHCSGEDGRVTSLVLGGHNLQTTIVDPALFRLNSLRYLDLSGNNFSMSQLPVTGWRISPSSPTLTSPTPTSPVRCRLASEALSTWCTLTSPQASTSFTMMMRTR
ncbi:hypothetical protein EE612_058449, partial [Oryza sativa]